MQNIQRSLVDRRSLNGLQVIRLHYITADDVEKYMTVIRESIKVIEIGLCQDEGGGWSWPFFPGWGIGPGRFTEGGGGVAESWICPRRFAGEGRGNCLDSFVFGFCPSFVLSGVDCSLFLSEKGVRCLRNEGGGGVTSCWK